METRRQFIKTKLGLSRTLEGYFGGHRCNQMLHSTALEGRKRIDRGLHNFKEIGTVYYDASIITIEEMKDALRKAGTRQGTVK